MRSARLHELRLPTRYALWRAYIHGTDLQNRIGPQAFTELLNRKQAIELVDQKGVIKCKTLNEKIIRAAIQELYSRPFQSAWLLYFRKVAKLLTLHQSSGTQGPTR